MTELLGARRLRDLLESHGVRPTKTLGQNFVIDPNTIRKVVALAGVGAGDGVVEIGAGAGSLTLGLAGAAAHVTAVEIDPRLVEILREVTAGLDVEVVAGDALKLDLSALRGGSLVANLPYNIAATVVVKVLEEAPGVRRLTVMTQREVAERLAAPPGSKVYGLTSVLVAFHASARVVGHVSRSAFYPVPNVDSSLVQIERRGPRDVALAEFKRVARAAFAQRRKTVRNNLIGIEGLDREIVEGCLGAAGIDPGARAETLSVDQLVALTSAIGAARR